MPVLRPYLEYRLVVEPRPFPATRAGAAVDPEPRAETLHEVNTTHPKHRLDSHSKVAFVFGSRVECEGPEGDLLGGGDALLEQTGQGAVGGSLHPHPPSL